MGTATGSKASGRIIARDIRVDVDRATASLSCELVADGAGLPPRLWFRFPAEVFPLIDVSGSPFIPILVLVAMRLRRELHVEAEVSPALVASLDRTMGIYADWGSSFQPLWRVNVTTGLAAIPRGESAGAFFSCGLDSTYSLLKNALRYPAEDARSITHLMIVHGFDVGLDDGPLFEQLRGRAQRVADRYGK